MTMIDARNRTAEAPAGVARIDTRALAAIDPAAYYSPSTYSPWLGVTERTGRAYCRTGKLKYRRDPFDRRRFLVRGADLLAVVGDLMQASAPAETETHSERQGRAEANLRAILGMKKGRAG